MKEIKELDTNKYLVLKWEDIEKLPLSEQNDISGIIQRIGWIRNKEDKKDNKYLVLNLDDEIDMELFNEIYYKFTTGERVLIKDIAVGLVNAVLRVKDKQ